MRIILLLTFVLWYQFGNCCDICSCASGNANLGILPQFHKHFIGIHYQYRTYQTELYTLGENNPKLSKERFQLIELRGRFNIGKRWQLFAFVPYQWNHQTKGAFITRFQGIGDVSTIANYNLINTGDSLYVSWKQNLQFGGGLKLPTGKSQRISADGLYNANIQTGTGSIDFIANLIYTLRKANFGINASSMFRYTTENPMNFRQGNKISSSVNGFYWGKLENDQAILPILGFMYEARGADIDHGLAMKTHKAHDLSAQFACSYFSNRFIFQIAAQLPLIRSNPDLQPLRNISTTILYTIK